MNRLIPLLAALAAALALLAACGGDQPAQVVRVQLDWTPNTNHTGIYVAQAEGWYEDEGIEVVILPFSGTNGDLAVSEGIADVAFSFATSVPFSRAGGLDVVSIAAVLQTSPTEIAVLADGPIQRLRDLDGQRYAGWGLPYEQPQWRTIIQADGGQGDIEGVVLNTGAYEALEAGRVQAVEFFATWEGINWQLEGLDVRTWKLSDVGVPDRPAVLLVASQETIDAKRNILERFLRATLRGYEFAAADPADAASILIETAGDDIFSNPELVYRSAELLAAEYYLAPDGRWGSQTLKQWTDYPQWLYQNNLLQNQNGDPLQTPPNYAAHFTTTLLTTARTP